MTLLVRFAEVVSLRRKPRPENPLLVAGAALSLAGADETATE